MPLIYLQNSSTFSRFSPLHSSRPSRAAVHRPEVAKRMKHRLRAAMPGTYVPTDASTSMIPLWSRPYQDAARHPRPTYKYICVRYLVPWYRKPHVWHDPCLAFGQNALALNSSCRCQRPCLFSLKRPLNFVAILDLTSPLMACGVIAPVDTKCRHRNNDRIPHEDASSLTGPDI